MNQPESVKQQLKEEEFAKQFASCQRFLFSFLMKFLMSADDANEVLQETNIILWRKKDEIESIDNFLAWASTIARYQALAYLRQKRREIISLPGDLLDQIADESLENYNQQEARSRALSFCMSKLNDTDQQLIHQVYGKSATIKDSAKSLNRPVNTIYKAVRRIRHALFNCIKRQLVSEDR